MLGTQKMDKRSVSQPWDAKNHKQGNAPTFN